MRRNHLAILGLAVLVAGATAFAAETKPLEMTGNVKAIDVKARTVSIDTGSATDTFKLASSVAIDQQSTHKALTLDQLKVGDRVQVHYTMSGQDRMASRLDVLPTSQAANTPPSTPRPGTTKHR